MCSPAIPRYSDAGAPPALLLVAHGSRDPRHAETVTALCARVRALLPGARVEVGYLDFAAPSVPEALRRLARARVRRVVAVPLLLSRAFHAKSDLPAVLHQATRRLPCLTVVRAPVLGPAPELTAVVERRLGEAGVGRADRAHTGVVLASAGSSDPEAILASGRLAAAWQRTGGWHAVRPAFASATGPGTADVVRALRADGVRRIAVAPYVVAPGRLPDRIATSAREAGADVLAAEIGPAWEVAGLVVARYRMTVAGGGTHPGLTA